MIYFIDGSKEAFLTTFLLAYNDEDPRITSAHKQLVLGQECVFVKADPARAARVEKRLLALDKSSIRELDLLLRSASLRREQVAFNYLHFLTEKKAPVRKMTDEPEVSEAEDIMFKVSAEIKRLSGFVRFVQTESGIPYAPLAPENDIVDLLAENFRKNTPACVLHDIPRRKAAVYDGTGIFTAPLEKADIFTSAREEEFENIWRKFCENVHLPSHEALEKFRTVPTVQFRSPAPDFPDPKD